MLRWLQWPGGWSCSVFTWIPSRSTRWTGFPEVSLLHSQSLWDCVHWCVKNTSSETRKLVCCAGFLSQQKVLQPLLGTATGQTWKCTWFLRLCLLFSPPVRFWIMLCALVYTCVCICRNLHNNQQQRLLQRSKPIRCQTDDFARRHRCGQRYSPVFTYHHCSLCEGALGN